MEIPIIGSIVAMGYYYNNQKKQIKNEQEPKNIFESKRAVRVLQGEQKLANKVYKEKNRTIPGPPRMDKQTFFNKIDYKNSVLPIEFNDQPRGDLFGTVDTSKPPIRVKETPTSSRVQYSSNNATSGGWHGIGLNGLPIDPLTFSHNNLTPFFGGSVKQNVDDKAYATTMENFTGNNVESYKEKVENGPLFQPQANMTNPYGMSSTVGFEQDRYINSKIMNNVGPVEKINVGPGLAAGFTALPSGGYQQANTRDYVLPKTVDELRVLTNPKLTYAGRVLTGQKGVKPGKIGQIEKRHPDSFYINSPERYFTTVGAQTAARMRPNVVLRPTHRRKTSTKTYLGPSKLANGGGKQELRPKFRKSCKQTYTYGYRNLDASGTWDGTYDYGKKNIIRRPTDRKDATQNDGHLNPAFENTKGELRNNQAAKTTVKESTENNESEGFLTPVGNEHGYIYDPNQTAKTTIKQTTIDNDYVGTFDGDKKGYIYDPNSVAKTTIRETTENNDYEGQISMPSKGYVKDKLDTARITTRQTTQLEGYVGAPNEAGKFGKVQNQKVRNTMRQFYNKGTIGGAGAVNAERPQSYEAIYNSISKSVRSFLDKGFTPGMGSALTAKLNHDMNATTKKTNEIKDKYLNERGMAPDKIYNSIAANMPGAETKGAKRLPNEPIQDRIGSEMVQQLLSNPYSQPLSSYAFP